MPLFSFHNASFTFVLGLALGRGMEIFKPKITHGLHLLWSWNYRLGDQHKAVSKSYTITSVSSGAGVELEPMEDAVTGKPFSGPTGLTVSALGEGIFEVGQRITMHVTQRNWWGRVMDTGGHWRWLTCSWIRRLLHPRPYA